MVALAPRKDASELIGRGQVSAKDSATGRSNKITITNERGRLSQADIEKMVCRKCL